MSVASQPARAARTRAGAAAGAHLDDARAGRRHRARPAQHVVGEDARREPQRGAEPGDRGARVGVHLDAAHRVAEEVAARRERRQRRQLGGGPRVGAAETRRRRARARSAAAAASGSPAGVDASVHSSSSSPWASPAGDAARSGPPRRASRARGCSTARTAVAGARGCAVSVVIRRRAHVSPCGAPTRGRRARPTFLEERRADVLYCSPSVGGSMCAPVGRSQWREKIAATGRRRPTRTARGTPPSRRGSGSAPTSRARRRARRRAGTTTGRAARRGSLRSFRVRQFTWHASSPLGTTSFAGSPGTPTAADGRRRVASVCIAALCIEFLYALRLGRSRSRSRG